MDEAECAALLRGMTRDRGTVTGSAELIQHLARLGLVDEPQIRTGRGSGPIFCAHHTSEPRSHHGRSAINGR